MKAAIDEISKISNYREFEKPKSQYLLWFESYGNSDSGWFRVTYGNTYLYETFWHFKMMGIEERAKLEAKYYIALDWVEHGDFYFISKLFPFSDAFYTMVMSDERMMFAYNNIFHYGADSSRWHQYIPFGIMVKLWKSGIGTSTCKCCGFTSYLISYSCDKIAGIKRYMVCPTCLLLGCENSEYGLQYLSNMLTSFYPQHSDTPADPIIKTGKTKRWYYLYGTEKIITKWRAKQYPIDNYDISEHLKHYMLNGEIV